MRYDDTQHKEGTLRLMTPGEIAMARCLFGDSIVYSRVWVHCDSYFPFGLQNAEYAMAPNGELWFRPELYQPDYSALSVRMEHKHMFVHELGHVWQHQHGQWVRMRGLLSWAADYSYRFDKCVLSDYSLEQQASILADYWLLSCYGISKWLYYQNAGRMVVRYRGVDKLNDIPFLYRKIITGRA